MNFFDTKLNSLTRNAYLTGLLNGLAVGILVGFCYTIFVEWLGR